MRRPGDGVFDRLFRPECDETETATLLGHGIHFDGAFLNFAVFLEVGTKVGIGGVEGQATAEEFPETRMEDEQKLERTSKLAELSIRSMMETANLC